MLSPVLRTSWALNYSLPILVENINREKKNCQDLQDCTKSV